MTKNTDADRALHVCPKCNTANKTEELAGRDYRCAKCGVELAHVDVTGSGVVRGIFGWLRSAGDIVSDRYRIKSVLGKGGFGVTYLVEDLRLNGKRRALKEVPELLFDEQETLLLSRLSHPAIPDIIDRSISDGMVYFVLEFGGNRTLSDERRRLNGRIPFTTLLPWMRQLCEVLIYLHNQTPPVIHRDLKPDNILIDEDNRIMLIDFGIAKENDPSTVTRTLGRAVTHGFSPPEQMLGTGTDVRSDIYSLAATFYALVTGVTPTGAHDRISGKTLTSASALAPDLPVVIDEALLQALNLNANQRQQSVTEILQVLGEYTRTGGVSDDATLILPAASKRTDSTPSVPPVASPSAKTNTTAQKFFRYALGSVSVLAGLGAASYYYATREPGGTDGQQTLPTLAPVAVAPPTGAASYTAPIPIPTPTPVVLDEPPAVTTQHLTPPVQAPQGAAPTEMSHNVASVPEPSPVSPPRKGGKEHRLALRPVPEKLPSATPRSAPKTSESTPDWSGSMSRGDVHRTDQ